ncbi:hypothetical protein KCU92_g181, partial [Aureobasidium melanogenum]
MASASRIASRTAARSSGALLEATLSLEARSKPTGLSNGAGFVGIDIEGACIHDVVMEESDPVAAVSAALSRISEFPEADIRGCWFSSDVRPSPNSGHRDVEEPTLPTEYKATSLCSTVAQPSYNLRLRWPVTNNPYVIWCYVLEALLIMPVQSRIRAPGIAISNPLLRHRCCLSVSRTQYFVVPPESCDTLRLEGLWIRSALESSMADIIAGSENEWKERRLVQTTPYCAAAVKC